jgi:hypothetical protein
MLFRLRGFAILAAASMVCGCADRPAPVGVAAYAPPPPAPVMAAAPPMAAGPLSDPLIMRRGVIGADAPEPPGFALYAYFLADSPSDLEKRKAALRVYLCDLSDIPSAYPGGPAKRGLYLVPVKDHAPLYDKAGDADPSQLVGSYDYSLAHDILAALVSDGYMKPDDLRPDGIYFAAFDRPIRLHPARAAIYEISRLPTPKNVADWLIRERQSIEQGQAPTTQGVKRVPSTPVMILDGLGTVVIDLLQIKTPVAEAASTACG